MNVLNGLVLISISFQCISLLLTKQTVGKTTCYALLYNVVYITNILASIACMIFLLASSSNNDSTNALLAMSFVPIVSFGILFVTRDLHLIREEYIDNPQNESIVRPIALFFVIYIPTVVFCSLSTFVFEKLIFMAFAVTLFSSIFGITVDPDSTTTLKALVRLIYSSIYIGCCTLSLQMPHMHPHATFVLLPSISAVVDIVCHVFDNYMSTTAAAYRRLDEQVEMKSVQLADLARSTEADFLAEASSKDRIVVQDETDGISIVFVDYNVTKRIFDKYVHQLELPSHLRDISKARMDALQQDSDNSQQCFIFKDGRLLYPFATTTDPLAILALYIKEGSQQSIVPQSTC